MGDDGRGGGLDRQIERREGAYNTHLQPSLQLIFNKDTELYSPYNIAAVLWNWAKTKGMATMK